MANNEISEACKDALKRLARSTNVLISGAPGTGKSRLLAEVALAFETGHGIAASGGPPIHNPIGGIPIPPAMGNLATDFPGPTKTSRKVFRMVLHQNSKYRDFVSGITPAVNKQAGEPDFSIVEGTLYRASQHASKENGAALLIIDEINRGPAVQVFGGAIVAIESDKRLAPNGSKRGETQFFELLEPGTGEVVEYALPHDLYILAAMNQADASVEPLDVAFLRRWEPLRLLPDESVLRKFYGLGPKTGASLPDTPSAVSHVFEASVRAWAAINDQISLGRGFEFQIGHGVLFSDVQPNSMELPDALDFLCIGWDKIRSHVEEVFFGDTRGIAATLNALDGPACNPFTLQEKTFANDLRFKLEGPSNFSASTVFLALKAFSRE